MRITIYSDSEFFKFGFQCLVNDCDLVWPDDGLHLHIVDLMDKSDSLSFVKMLDVSPLDFSATNNIILIMSAGLYVSGSRLRGVTMVSGNSTLKQLRYWVRKAIKGECVNVEHIHQLSRKVPPCQFSPYDRQLIYFMKKNMSPAAIASAQKVSIKTLYSRMSSLKQKCMLASTRELYLNAEYIYQQISEAA
ncbi:hypothetical protein [Enterobacter sp. 638]|uniref:Uncharacterized protein n=1 Tax=Enterobacter sp. (strain 638) TaxID=399742 RepID=A0A9J9GJX6_ENT38|nr:hypothetical protein [Enterobacter sp. 638]ABP62810.1 hypothetical protein Ent638_4205 [Enterobacter sp. 638]